MALVERLQAAEPQFSRIGAGILAALALGFADDSRSFARQFGIAHALILRELAGLSCHDAWLTILRRDPRTQRTWYQAGEALRRFT
ncbi:hypothetical protein ACFO1V_11625 [Daeguia caeni]|uniref:Uncharacterized protein n=1 Tax=Daeguia caeni TaxID=439612 RepID=A0ABV9H6H9_9HYPH